MIFKKALEIKSENQLINSFIQRLADLYKKAKVRQKNIIHIADRGFDRQAIIEKFKKMKLSFVIRAKDKKITLKNGQRAKLYQLEPGIYPHTLIETWNIFLTVVVLRAKEKKDDRKEVKMVLLTNYYKKGLTLFWFQKAYQIRWSIETINKILKSDYDIEGFRVRSLKMIRRIVSVTIIAFNLSQYWRAHYKRLFRGPKKIWEVMFASIYKLRRTVRKMLNFDILSDFWLKLAPEYCDSG